jgi:hypothetical protein
VKKVKSEDTPSKAYAAYTNVKLSLALKGDFNHRADADAYAACMRGETATIRALIVFRRNQASFKNKVLTGKAREKAQQVYDAAPGPLLDELQYPRYLAHIERDKKGNYISAHYTTDKPAKVETPFGGEVKFDTPFGEER